MDIPGHRVRAAISGRNFNGGVCFGLLDDSQQSHFGVRLETVAGFAFGGGGATTCHPREPLKQQAT